MSEPIWAPTVYATNGFITLGVVVAMILAAAVIEGKRKKGRA